VWEAQPGVTPWKREIRLALVGIVNLTRRSRRIVYAGPGIDLWKWLSFKSANSAQRVWANLYLAGLNLLLPIRIDVAAFCELCSRGHGFLAATRRAVSIGNLCDGAYRRRPVQRHLANHGRGHCLLRAQLEERAVVFQSVLDSVRLEEVMLTDFATLFARGHARRCLQKAVHSLQDDFPVVREVTW